jgi:hypothetical protein
VRAGEADGGDVVWLAQRAMTPGIWSTIAFQTRRAWW